MIRINQFCKVEGYEINKQESVEFLYTNNELPEREIYLKIFTKV